MCGRRTVCFSRRSFLLRSGNRKKTSVGGKLFIGHASRKNLLSRQTQKYFDQRSLDFDHLRCKKNCGRRTLLPRLRQNFSQRSILLCARQLLKQFRPGKLMLPHASRKSFLPRENSRWVVNCAAVTSVARMCGRRSVCFSRRSFLLRSGNRKKTSVGGKLFIGHASRKNLLSRQTQKYFDQRSLDFNHLRCKKNCGRRTLLPRLRQNFSQRSILLCARQLLKQFRPGKLMLPSRQSQKFSAARKLSVSI